ncbi:unnamed protein product [Peronospora belbahrii]|uniref:Uncharacterized protein n=1 Tax=Peronospora belbahrii TaxID=622444 RepID=A0AAU9L5A1_9STRA|nr:unnamed protein product [Peronospora belbahrii]CAH0522053.1 unnamed protein product [Peronospora belbahrii]
MKRNFGSLNLAALDLTRPSTIGADATDCSLEDRFSAMGPGTEDYTMDASSEYSSDENVGFPMERIQLSTTTDMHLILQSLCDDTPQNINMKDDMTELSLPSVTQSHNGDSDVRTRELLHPSSSETPQPLHAQHQVELNALRCLSLKVMLSNLSTPNSNNNITSTSANASVASNKPNYTYPGVTDRTKTALLPIRHPSLQSV